VLNNQVMLVGIHIYLGVEISQSTLLGGQSTLVHNQSAIVHSANENSMFKNMTTVVAMAAAKILSC